MRIVMNQYADGDKFAVETATDGSEVVKEFLPVGILLLFSDEPKDTLRRDRDTLRTLVIRCAAAVL
jgi:hypothetical protein